MIRIIRRILERTYLLWMGSLICTALLMTSGLSKTMSAEHHELDMLRWVEMTQTVIKEIIYGLIGAMGIIGAISDILISCLISASIPVELKTVSNADTAACGTVCRFIVHSYVYTARHSEK